MARHGFTLIEILIVVAITAMLSGLAIVYSHVGQDQVSLSVEAAKVSQLILQAKELSVATYSEKQETCGYGIHFDYASSTYSLFEYDIPSSAPAGTICPSLAAMVAPGFMQTGALVENEYESGSWNIATAQGVELDGSGAAASDTITDIVFSPPDPFTLVSYDGQTLYDTLVGAAPADGAQGGNIYLETADGSTERVVSVTFAGQVSD